MRVPAVLLTGLLLLVAAAGFGVIPALAAPNAENVTLYQTENADLADADAIETAIENGTVEPATEMVAGETLVVAIDSERLASDLDEGDGSTTERFFDLLEPGDLRVVQTNPTPQQTVKIVPLGPDNTTVYRSETTTYLLVDTGAVDYERYRTDENEPSELGNGDQFAIEFGYGDDEPARSASDVTMYTTEAELYTSYEYDPLPPEVVRRPVKVNIEPDDLVVRVVLETGRTITAPVESVEWSGVPGVEIDLRGVDPGTEYALELVHDGDVVDRYDGTVREPEATVTDVEVTEVENWTAVNVTATLSHGGEVRVLNEDGETLGQTRSSENGTWLEPGVEIELTVRLRGEATDELRVRAAREDGASEEFYEGDDAEAIVDFGDREFRTPTPRSTERPTATPTETPTATTSTPTETSAASPTNAESTATPPATSDDRIPGFTLLTALAALLALILAAVRRE